MRGLLVKCVQLIGTGYLLTLTGCPNPNLYGTPRTVAPGKISHSIAVESYGFAGDTTYGPIPSAPTYTLRVGAVENLDIGVRVANLSTLALDAKYNFLKSPAFDMAVAPGAQVFYFSASNSGGDKASISGTYLQLPLIAGINVGESVSLVPSAGIMYGLVSGSSSSSDGSDSVKASSNTGIIGRFGLGANFRLTPSFALHPEFTIMKPFKSDSSGLLYLAGFGFNFGGLPDYSDAK